MFIALAIGLLFVLIALLHFRVIKRGIARLLEKRTGRAETTIADPETESEVRRAERIVVLQHDFRDAELADGMTPDQWVKQILVTALRPLGLGTHEVDLIMPRWMQRVYVDYNSWAAPGLQALTASNIHMTSGTYAYDNATETTLLQFLRITIAESDNTPETPGTTPLTTDGDCRRICSGLSQVAMVVNRIS